MFMVVSNECRFTAATKRAWMRDDFLRLHCHPDGRVFVCALVHWIGRLDLWVQPRYEVVRIQYFFDDITD